VLSQQLVQLYESILATEAGPGSTWKDGLFDNAYKGKLKDFKFGKHTVLEGFYIIEVPYADALKNKYISTPTANVLKELEAAGFTFTKAYFFTEYGPQKLAYRSSAPVGTLVFGTDSKGKSILYKRDYNPQSYAMFYYEDKQFKVKDLLDVIKSGKLFVKPTFDNLLQYFLFDMKGKSAQEGVQYIIKDGAINTIKPCVFTFGFNRKFKKGPIAIDIPSTLPYKFGPTFHGTFRIGEYITNYDNFPTTIEGYLNINVGAPSLVSNLKNVTYDISLYVAQPSSLEGMPVAGRDVTLAFAGATLKNLIGMQKEVENLRLRYLFDVGFFYKDKIPKYLRVLPNEISFEGISDVIKGNLSVDFPPTPSILNELVKVDIADRVRGKISIRENHKIGGVSYYDMKELPDAFKYTRRFKTDIEKLKGDVDLNLGSLLE
jgi:hypothetical protein